MIESINSHDGSPLQEFEQLYRQIAQLPPYLRSKLMPACEQVGQFLYLQSKLIKIAQARAEHLARFNRKQVLKNDDWMDQSLPF